MRTPFPRLLWSKFAVRAARITPRLAAPDVSSAVAQMCFQIFLHSLAEVKGKRFSAEQARKQALGSELRASVTPIYAGALSPRQDLPHSAGDRIADHGLRPSFAILDRKLQSWPCFSAAKHPVLPLLFLLAKGEENHQRNRIS